MTIRSTAVRTSLILVCALVGASTAVTAQNHGFVTTSGTRFEINGLPFSYAGANFWSGMNLASGGPGGDRARLRVELNTLRTLGPTVLRIMAGTEGPNGEPWRISPALQTSPGVYDPAVLDGLDYLLSEMGERGLRAVMCLNNFWPWSGGMAQYLNWNGAGPIPYPPPATGGDWNVYASYTAQFYSNAGARQQFQNFISFIVNHINPYTGLAYKDDPTIMAWELANEPRGYSNSTALNAWIDQTAAYIKSLDPHHLVTTGAEGDTPWPSWNGLDFVANHDGPNVDYATCHVWPQNWGWYDPLSPSGYPNAEALARTYVRNHIAKASNILGKPLVLEEFGLARDGGSYDPAMTTANRDNFFRAMFEEVLSASTGGFSAGDSFWAWSGDGRPVQPYGSYWRSGDPWVGDPPHEPQGWYSVYDTDTSTLNLISAHAADLSALAGDQGLSTISLHDIDSGLTSPGGNYRWLDTADQAFAAAYRNSYNYTQATVTIQHTSSADTLRGLLVATNLKPNFTYQLKLLATPGTPSSESIGLTGRWWQEEWNGLPDGAGGAWINGSNLNNKGSGSSPNPNDGVYLSRRDIADPTSPTGKKYRYTGYLVFGYVITDERGNAVLSFEANSCYHVLWKTVQTSPGASDGPVRIATFDADPSMPAYDGDYPPSTVGVFGEWERLPAGGVFLPAGNYDATFLLTEESFHGSGGTYAGGWAAAMGGAAVFTITGGIAPPDAPAVVMASDGTFPGLVRVAWTASGGATSYEVYRDGALVGSPTTLLFDDAPGDGGVHAYTVAARNLAGVSAASVPDTGYAGTVPAAPDPPTGVAASDGTFVGFVRVTWTAAAGATSYEVYRDGALVGNPTAPPFDDTPGDVVVHAYTVTARNAAGASAASVPDTGYAATIPAVPDAPTGVTASDGTFLGFVRVAWTASVGATSYEVYRDGALVGSPTASPFDDTPGDTVVHAYTVTARNAAGVSAASGPDSGYAGSPTIVKGPYLQNVTTNSVVVMWETDVDSDGKVDYGTAALTLTASDSMVRTLHEVMLPGLQSGTRYSYIVSSGGISSATFSFVTAPAADASFRFAAYGDTRTNPTDHANVVQAIISHQPGFVLHVGDLVDPGRDASAWKPQFFDPAGPLIANVPLFPALGNHDYAGSGPMLFYDLFSLPGNESWYAFSCGPARFVVLNTNMFADSNASFAPGSAQYQWLVSELQSSAFQGATWRFVIFHHPPYSSRASTEMPYLQQYLVPLFELYGVQVVFNGHDHNYRHVLRNAVHYIVTGAGGAPLYDIGAAVEGQVYAEKIWEHCIVDVTATTLTFAAYRNDGTLLDTFSLPSAPPVPTGVTASDGTFLGIVRVTWAGSAGATSYEVYRDGALVGSPTSSPYDDTPGDTVVHAYTVTARNAAGVSPASGPDSGSAATLPAVPAAPTGVTASDGTFPGLVRVAWTGSAGATSYEVYRDGVLVGSPTASPFDDTPGDTVVHQYTVTARNAAGVSLASGPDSGSAGVGSPPTPFVTGAVLGTVRNNSSAWVGMRFRVGASPVEVQALGRIYVAGNVQSHALQLVEAATKATVASVTWTPAGGVADQITYVALPASVSLAANTEYYLASQETAGGDRWYSYTTAVTTTSVATVLSAVYRWTNESKWYPYGAAGAYTYGPVSLTYYR